MIRITLLKSAMRSTDVVRMHGTPCLVGNRLGATPNRQMRGRRLPKLQWSFETSRCRSTLTRRVQPGNNKGRSQKGGVLTRGPNLMCHRLAVQPELLRWGQMLA